MGKMVCHLHWKPKENRRKTRCDERSWRTKNHTWLCSLDQDSYAIALNGSVDRKIMDVRCDVQTSSKMGKDKNDCILSFLNVSNRKTNVLSSILPCKLSQLNSYRKHNYSKQFTVGSSVVIAIWFVFPGRLYSLSVFCLILPNPNSLSNNRKIMFTLIHLP